MLNWEDRLQSLWQATQERFTTTDAVLLGVCAYLASRLGIPVAVLRIAVLACAYFWPLVTVVVYVVARFFIDSDEETI
ncbi:MAG: PspC domain-containing protein [Gammaproteobacteria bacterium]|nr:PspC domain-containing protein [Gammaproteobacteria bacterium]